MIDFCKNCSCETTGLYCAQCGQPTSTKRIDWAFCTSEFLFNNYTYHKGMLFTVKSLILHPKKMVTNYLEGKRICYTGAVQFFLFILIFRGLISLFSGDAQTDSPGSIMINGVKSEIDLQKYIRPMTLIYSIISSLGNYLVYRSKKYNLAEHLVLNLYILGMCFLLSTIFNIISFNRFTDYSFFLMLFIAITYYIRIFYDKKIRLIDFLKALWCMILNLFFALILLIIGVIIYAYQHNLLQDAVKITLHFHLPDIFLT